MALQRSSGAADGNILVNAQGSHAPISTNRSAARRITLQRLVEIVLLVILGFTWYRIHFITFYQSDSTTAGLSQLPPFKEQYGLNHSRAVGHLRVAPTNNSSSPLSTWSSLFFKLYRPLQSVHYKNHSVDNTHGHQVKKSDHPRTAVESFQSLLELTRCFNQTLCIPPMLQLHQSYNVYYCKRVSYGVRFFYLVREGLLLHPKIRLVDDPAAADVIICKTFLDEMIPPWLLLRPFNLLHT